MNPSKAIWIAAFCASVCSCASVGTMRSTRRALEAYPPSEWAAYLYTEGMKAKLIGGNAADAAQIFANVTILDPEYAPAWFELAGIYGQATPQTRPDLPKALEFSRRAVTLDSTNVWYQGLTGHLLIQSRKYEEAMDVYRRVMALDPNNPEHYRIIAALYEQLDQPFTAISLLDAAQYKFGRIEELSDFKRQLLIKVNLYDKAIAESQALVEEYPWEPRNYTILAALYDLRGKDSLAQATYRQAMEIDSTDVETLLAVNDYSRKRGDMATYFSTARRIVGSPGVPADAKVEFVEGMTSDKSFYMDNFLGIRSLGASLLALYPDDYDVVELYGGMVIAYGGAEPGLEFFKPYLQRADVPVSVFNTVMDIETYLKRPDSVARYSEMAVRRFSPGAELYMRHAGALSYMERYADAMQYYEKAMKYAGTDSMRSVIFGVMGDTEFQRGNRKKCYEYQRKALKAWPDNVLVLNNMSYFLSTDGPDGHDIPQAVALAARAVELAPGNPTYLDTYGWALFKAGRLAEAKKAVQQAISLDSSNSKELFIHYGDILYALKEYFMATVYWKKALDNGYDPAEVARRMKTAEGK